MFYHRLWHYIYFCLQINKTKKKMCFLEFSTDGRLIQIRHYFILISDIFDKDHLVLLLKITTKKHEHKIQICMILQVNFDISIGFD